jgi:mannose-1-phosphate guanylyltransferase
MPSDPAIDRLFCAIMAGGSGIRFWPLSRSDRPKQLLPLLGDRSLLAATAERVRPLCPPERWLVVSAARLEAAVRAELPDLPAANLVLEPVPRNTAPCMALAAAAARQLRQDAVVALLPSDHFVADGAAFSAALTAAAEVAATGAIVTLGVRPTRPETGYGYIEIGEAEPGRVDCPVERFVEKPDPTRALGFVAGRRHLWNSGVYVAKAEVALAALARHLPEVRERLAALAAAPFGTQEFRAAVASFLAVSPSISIDYAVAERETGLRVIPLEAGWSDVGTWQSLLDHRPEGARVLQSGAVVEIGCADSVLWSEGPVVAALGLQGLAVVATDDAVLVLPLERSQELRQLVSAIEARGFDVVQRHKVRQ